MQENPASKSKTEKEILLDKMNEIEREAGGISNIGMTSDYWEYLKQYRSLEAQGK